MLPNHSPLTIAEQFGTLETLHPGRIDLGLGRAPGSDQNTMRALRRDPTSADTLPAGRAGAAGLPGRRDPDPGRGRHPGQGHATCRCTSWARRCSAPSSPRRSGLPYAFASHFAPQRARRPPSPSTAASSSPPRSSTGPHVIAGVNVIAADTAAQAQEKLQAVTRGPWPSACSAAGRQLHRRGGRPAARRRAPGSTSSQMLTYAAVGTPAEVGDYLEGFREARRRRRADRRPPGADHRGPAALGRAAGAGDGAGARLTAVPGRAASVFAPPAGAGSPFR